MQLRRILTVLAAAGLMTVAAAAPAYAHNPHPVRANLLGANEVPANTGDPDGTGVFLMKINVQTGKLCYVLSVYNVGTVTGVHIHRGSAGEEGPVRVELDEPMTGSNAVAACTWVDPDLAVRMADHPRRFYLNVHTTAFPDGAIRGQLRNWG